VTLLIKERVTRQTRYGAVRMYTEKKDLLALILIVARA
jgi:nitrate reductase gamma subunit